MEGREAMASYHLYRGIGIGPGTGSPQQQQQQQQQGLHGLRPMSANPGSNLQVQQSSSIGGGPGGGSIGSGFQVESPPSISQHGVNVGAAGGGGGGAGAGGPGEPVKRKRGRPRKYGPGGSVSLALSPMSSSPPGSGMASGSAPGMSSGAPEKRGRGRPPGTGRKQLLASLGEWIVGSAGMGFTPHIITIAVGEDIASKIMSFSQQGPRAICILSATGSVSTVMLRQSSTSGGAVTYEGRFEILSLSGSYLMTDGGGSRNRSGGLSISLASPDGRVIGGGVGGLLIAASNVQVVVGSFIYGGSKQKSKAKTNQDPGMDSELQIGDKPGTTSGGLPIQSPPPVMTWPGSRQIDMRNAHIDIDLTRG
ncbi:AF0104/ALDC/Ptd012-like protein [Dioscorea alata]|uniref:AF0104/ALDC/Ptd012-like protein n=1 Tax=Dioscorea alata TaxID=55571 RepID=A0ACB7WRJ2_DIOAL|nr:AF0104/ALDC/Ptd012-like protein [Dioscorea alata]